MAQISCAKFSPEICLDMIFFLIIFSLFFTHRDNGYLILLFIFSPDFLRVIFSRVNSPKIGGETDLFKRTLMLMESAFLGLSV